MRIGELPFLVTAADAGRRIVELASVEAGGEADVVAQAIGKESVYAGAELAPGGGDNARLDLVALDAVIGRRLVRYVEDAERDEEQAAFRVDRIAEAVVQVGLFNLHFALVALADHAVLEL